METGAPQADWDEAAAGALTATCGAEPGADAYGPSASFDAPAAPAADGLVVPLPDLGLLAASGADATAFLHGQFTNDLEHLAPGTARWYGYCTPQGRLLGLLLGWRDEGQIVLCASRTLSAALRKRLAMYVLRAKVKIEDRSNDMAIFGLAGEPAAAVLSALGIAAPAQMTVAGNGDLHAIGLPPAMLADECPRWLLAAPAGRAAELWGKLAGSLAPASNAHWRWLEIMAATPRVIAATSGQYLPQTLNLELTGGVDFEKGCYPGQEVVARTHYRGTAKRRMFRGHIAGSEPPPLADVTVAGAAEPAGTVICAAPAQGGGADLLFEVPTAVAGAALAPDGAPLLVDGDQITIETLVAAEQAP